MACRLMPARAAASWRLVVSARSKPPHKTRLQAASANVPPVPHSIASEAHCADDSDRSPAAAAGYGCRGEAVPGLAAGGALDQRPAARHREMRSAEAAAGDRIALLRTQEQRGSGVFRLSVSPERRGELPGLLAATRTGLTPAGDDELCQITIYISPSNSGHTRGK